MYKDILGVSIWLSEWVKNPVMSLQWLRLLLWNRFDPGFSSRAAGMAKKSSEGELKILILGNSVHMAWYICRLEYHSNRKSHIYQRKCPSTGEWMK